MDERHSRCYNSKIMTLNEIEQSIAELPPAELAKFREWFFEFDAKKWDDQIERDVAAGKLDSLADEAIRQHQAGDSTPL